MANDITLAVKLKPQASGVVDFGPTSIAHKTIGAQDANMPLAINASKATFGQGVTFEGSNLTVFTAPGQDLSGVKFEAGAKNVIDPKLRLLSGDFSGLPILARLGSVTVDHLDPRKSMGQLQDASLKKMLAGIIVSDEISEGAFISKVSELNLRSNRAGKGALKSETEREFSLLTEGLLYIATYSLAERGKSRSENAAVTALRCLEILGDRANQTHDSLASIAQTETLHKSTRVLAARIIMQQDPLKAFSILDKRGDRGAVLTVPAVVDPHGKHEVVFAREVLGKAAEQLDRPGLDRHQKSAILRAVAVAFDYIGQPYHGLLSPKSSDRTLVNNLLEKLREEPHLLREAKQVLDRLPKPTVGERLRRLVPI